MIHRVNQIIGFVLHMLGSCFVILINFIFIIIVNIVIIIPKSPDGPERLRLQESQV